MPLAKTEPRAIWRQGWLWPALHEPSPNCGPRPPGTAIDLALVHSISLPPGRFGTDAVRQLFTNTLDPDAHPYFERLRGLEVSAHFFIRRNGALWQFVSADERAWHAGKSRFQGRDNCNDYAVGIELEGLEGETFEPPQYRMLAWLCRALQARYPVRHITGHEHVAPGRKHDPGAGFSWSRLAHDLADSGLRIETRVQP